MVMTHTSDVAFVQSQTFLKVEISHVEQLHRFQWQNVAVPPYFFVLLSVRLVFGEQWLAGPCLYLLVPYQFGTCIS